VLATGEIRKDFLDIWSEEGLTVGASVNPPGVMASALNVAVMLLNGGELQDDILEGRYENALYLPIPLITNENLDEALSQVEGQPGHYSVTATVSPEEAEAFFQYAIIGKDEAVGVPVCPGCQSPNNKCQRSIAVDRP